MSRAEERGTRVTTSDRHGVSIFEVGGGHEAFVRLATAHHQRCLDDLVLGHPFSHPGHPQHIERLAAYWAEVFGGPPTYTRAAGDHSFMLGIHAQTHAEEEMGTRFVRCFVEAFDDIGLPPRPRAARDASGRHGVGRPRRHALRAGRCRRSSGAPRSPLDLGRAAGRPRTLT